MKLIKTISLSLLGASSFLAMMAVTATPASAQATRTWVSGVGDDVNPCSRTAPCKTFAGAISKTAAGGEINCLDPGGFGAVSIIKSMTISCPYTEGGALAGGNGITVNMPATTDVTLIRGLDIFGVNPPTNGIRFINNGTLHVEDSVIRRFNASNSAGISIAPSGANANVYLHNVLVAENGSGATGGGIVMQPSGTGSVRVSINNSRIHNNANFGIRANTTSNTGSGVIVSINGTSVAGSPTLVGALQPIGQAPILMQIIDSQFVQATTGGLVADGANTRFRVGGSTIFSTGTAATQLNGAVINTYGDNYVNGHFPNDGTFTLPAIPKT